MMFYQNLLFAQRFANASLSVADAVDRLNVLDQVAHDIKTPISSILLLLGRLRDAVEDKHKKGEQVSCVKYHFSTIVMIFMHQFEDRCNNTMH